MAIYHFCAQVISRAAGRSSVAAAAYRAGEKLTDHRLGITYDFTRRRQDIETEIMAPANAPEWVYDREQLWNAVEATERRKDAQLCREINIALPKELTKEQAKALVRAYVQEQFVDRGMVADVAYHWSKQNPHIHVMLTMRSIGPDGFGKKVREWNDVRLLQEWREQWAVYANRALERAGSKEQIDHRTLEAQGIRRTPQIHMGPHASAIERRGRRTDRGDTLRYINQLNGVVIDLQRARAEREALRQARERLARRGGAPSSYRALAEWVRAEQLLRRRITPEELPQLIREAEDALANARSALAPLVAERERLKTAGELLERKDRLREALARMETPAGSLRRAVSSTARQEYEQAKQELRQVDQQLQELGIVDRRDYDARKMDFERQRAADLRRQHQAIYEISRALSILSAAAVALGRLRARHVTAARSADRELADDLENATYER